MIFNHAKISFDIIDVFLLERANKKIDTINKSCYVFGFRLEGSSTFTHKEKTYNVEKNSLVYIPINSTYSQYTKYEKVIAVHLYVHNYKSTEISVSACNDSETIRNSFIEIYNIWSKSETGYYYKCMSLMYDIFSELHKLNALSNIDDKLQKSMIYINENVTNSDFSLAEAIKLSNFSEVYFRKLFKKSYNTTPIQYINSMRIAKSLSYIKSNYFSIEEISYLCGFNNPNYFNIVFKSIMGCSPGKYMKKYNLDISMIE